MGLFRKSKPEPQPQPEAPALSGEQQAAVDAFAMQVEFAAKIEDPAERLLKLQKISRKIDKLIDEKATALREAAKEEWIPSYARAGGGGTVVAVGLAIALHVTVIAILALPAIAAGIPYAGLKVEEATKQAFNENRTYFVALNAEQEKIAATIEKTIHEDLPAITKSSSFAAALEGVPGLSERFAEARRAQKPDGQPAAPKPPKPPRPEGPHNDKNGGGNSGFAL